MQRRAVCKLSLHGRFYFLLIKSTIAVGAPTGTQFSLKRCQTNNKMRRLSARLSLSLCPRPPLFCIQQTDGAASATAAAMGWCLLRHSSLRTPNALP